MQINKEGNIMKDKRNIILVLGYTDEMSNHISEKILKTYDIYDDYSIGYYTDDIETLLTGRKLVRKKFSFLSFCLKVYSFKCFISLIIRLVSSC